MNVLVIDVGGTHVKFLVTGQKNHREFSSGPTLTAKQMVAKVRNGTRDWTYDVVSIGYPGPVLRGRPIAEPHNLGRGWVGFNFEKHFAAPSKLLTTPPCRHWAATSVARCFSLAWAPASDQHLS